MSNAVSRLAIGPFPAAALTLAGLALVGFTGGATTALMMNSGSGTDTQEVSVHQATNQAGLTSTPTPTTPSAGTSLVTEAATSTASPKSESLPPSTSTTPRPAIGSAAANRESPPPVRVPVAPNRPVNPQPYRPAPAPQPGPPPPPPPPVPERPPVINIPLLPVNPPPVIEPKQLTFG